MSVGGASMRSELFGEEMVTSEDHVSKVMYLQTGTTINVVLESSAVGWY